MRNRSRQTGGMLIEVMFAMALMVVAALVLAATMPMAHTSRAKSNLSNLALSHAQKQLEAIKARGFDNITPTLLAQHNPADDQPALIDSATPVHLNTFSFTNIDGAVHDSVADVLPDGQGLVRIEDVQANQMRRVIVTVSWNERGETRSVSVGTLVAKLQRVW